jgi:hypothetical protein
MNRFSAGLKSSSPLLKQGAHTKLGVDDIGGSFSGSLAGASAPDFSRSAQKRMIARGK